jgi:hypothetical protein
MLKECGGITLNVREKCSIDRERYSAFNGGTLHLSKYIQPHYMFSGRTQLRQ